MVELSFADTLPLVLRWPASWSSKSVHWEQRGLGSSSGAPLKFAESGTPLTEFVSTDSVDRADEFRSWTQSRPQIRLYTVYIIYESTVEKFN